MDEKIVVKGDNQLNTVIVMMLIGMFVFCALCIYTGEPWMCIWFILIFGTLALMMLACSCIPKLELGRQKCIYRNVLGRTRQFLLTDIAKICREPENGFGRTALQLFDKNGEKLAEISSGMENYEKVLLFFQSYYHASKVWNGQEWVKPHKIELPEYQDTLEVKVNPQKLLYVNLPLYCIMLCTGVSLCYLALWYQADVAQNDMIDRIFLFLFGVAELLYAIALIIGNHILKRYERMVLTCDECFYVNSKGKQKKFLFQDIKKVKIESRKRGKSIYDVLTLKDGNDREIVCLNYSSYLDGVADVAAFISHWQRLNQ